MLNKLELNEYPPGKQIAIAITRFNKYVLSIKIYLTHDRAFFSNGIISFKLGF